MISEKENGLKLLRTELDKMDEHLLNTIKERIECCIRIAVYKRENDIPMMQPNRINFVKERAFKFAADNNISPNFLLQLYDLIISETCTTK